MGILITECYRIYPGFWADYRIFVLSFKKMLIKTGTQDIFPQAVEIKDYNAITV